MKRLAIILAGFSLDPSAHARSDTDYPHRDWGQVVTLDMTVAEATSCVAREMNRNGTSTVIPAEDGNDVDVKASAGIFGSVGEPWQTFKIRQSPGGHSTMRITYRHPLNQKAVSKNVERMKKYCLRVF